MNVIKFIPVLLLFYSSIYSQRDFVDEGLVPCMNFPYQCYSKHYKKPLDFYNEIMHINNQDTVLGQEY